MRRPQTHSPAKEKLLDAAQQLMLVKGYPATTVEEICEAAGLTKGSFFHYFESKEALAKAALDRYVSSNAQAIQQASFLKETDPLQRLYGHVDWMIEISKDPKSPNSCLVGTFAQELSDTHPQIRSLCATQFSKWAEAFKRDLDEAMKISRPNAPLDTLSLAEHFIAVLEGSLILAKAKQDKGVVEQSLRHFKVYLKSLFEK